MSKDTDTVVYMPLISCPFKTEEDYRKEEIFQTEQKDLEEEISKIENEGRSSLIFDSEIDFFQPTSQEDESFLKSNELVLPMIDNRKLTESSFAFKKEMTQENCLKSSIIKLEDKNDQFISKRPLCLNSTPNSQEVPSHGVNSSSSMKSHQSKITKRSLKNQTGPSSVTERLKPSENSQSLNQISLKKYHPSKVNPKLLGFKESSSTQSSDLFFDLHKPIKITSEESQSHHFPIVDFKAYFEKVRQVFSLKQGTLEDAIEELALKLRTIDSEIKQNFNKIKDFEEEVNESLDTTVKEDIMLQFLSEEHLVKNCFKKAKKVLKNADLALEAFQVKISMLSVETKSVELEFCQAKETILDLFLPSDLKGENVNHRIFVEETASYFAKFINSEPLVDEELLNALLRTEQFALRRFEELLFFAREDHIEEIKLVAEFCCELSFAVDQIDNLCTDETYESVLGNEGLEMTLREISEMFSYHSKIEEIRSTSLFWKIVCINDVLKEAGLYPSVNINEDITSS